MKNLRKIEKYPDLEKLKGICCAKAIPRINPNLLWLNDYICTFKVKCNAGNG